MLIEKLVVKLMLLAGTPCRSSILRRVWCPESIQYEWFEKGKPSYRFRQSHHHKMDTLPKHTLSLFILRLGYSHFNVFIVRDTDSTQKLDRDVDVAKNWILICSSGKKIVPNFGFLPLSSNLKQFYFNGGRNVCVSVGRLMR